jgi:ectoine hydroxylase-related dioxygenase (phytanoyl-CoA dioxygenase family)
MSPTMNPVTAAVITQDHIRQYEEKGYFLLERVIPDQHLALLREECQRYIDAADREMDVLGVTSKGLNHKGSRYFIAAYKQDRNPRIAEFLFSPLMQAICAATLGPIAYLFVEQYVVKAAEKGLKFSWHQDSGYVGHAHPPYLTCWCTLDDVTEENGTVYLLPYDRAESRDLVPHQKDPETGDKVGYFGDDPGIPLLAPAGSIACFSSTVFHRSGYNSTNRMRRIFLAQYSSEPILKADGSGPWNLAEAMPIPQPEIESGPIRKVPVLR